MVDDGGLTADLQHVKLALPQPRAIPAPASSGPAIFLISAFKVPLVGQHLGLPDNVGGSQPAVKFRSSRHAPQA
jgi:hypothetical protein